MTGPAVPAAPQWDAVVLLQMGGPATLDEIEPFLAALFGDPDIIRLPKWMRPFQPALGRYVAKRRTPKVQPRYAAMGGGSPLQRITAEQAAALEKKLGVPVHVAMRYTKPWAREAVAKLQAARARRVLLLPLYPHYSISTTQSNLRDFARAARDAELDAQIEYVRDWGMHPAYVDLVERTCLGTLAALPSGDKPHLVLSAHGVPERYVRLEGDTYQREVEASAQAVAKRLEEKFASVRQGYQSGLGPVEWLGPDTQALVEEIARSGAKSLVLSPLGFVSDHIETMYDMDTLFAEVAKTNGIERYARVPSFNASDAFAAALAEVAQGPTRPFEVSQWTS